MKLTFSTTPDLAMLMAREIAAGERAVSVGVKRGGDGLKADWRRDIIAAGLGRRLSGSIRSADYPRGRNSINAAALVWSKAPTVVAAHEQGPLIRSREGLWLAIPTPAAGRDVGGRRHTPLSWQRRTGLKLRHVFRGSGRPSLLVAEARVDRRGRAMASRSKQGRGVATVPIFVLVPQVRLRKRLDLVGAAARWADQVPGLIVDAWVDDRTGGGG